ncbi:hypothetical protein GC1_00013 [Gluconobacter phage GC1]|uniref:Uncharacterized protein n=1 Tax=Gluconobacter phage GC1 TaxID=2047788 RepID=A0A2I5AR77_9VIRU|nr:hypothetical protein FDJ08_gp13 [Gluconobacter phage GC1]ATS92581.1 hypothetical protein GC1_00013 [Gluconobacter phage GC1]
MAEGDTTSDDSVAARWRAIIASPMTHKWRFVEIVAGIIFATTIAFFWTRIMRDTLDLHKIIEG